MNTMTGNIDSLPVADWSAVLGDFQIPKLVATFDKTISSDLSLLDRAVAEMISAIERATCWPDTECIGFAPREPIANAIVHGNNCDPSRTVRLTASVTDNGDLLVTVKDFGPGFDPDKITNPTAAPNVLSSHGRGVFLMKHFMDQVEFSLDHGTEVHMRKPTVARVADSLPAAPS